MSQRPIGRLLRIYEDGSALVLTADGQRVTLQHADLVKLGAPIVPEAGSQALSLSAPPEAVGGPTPPAPAPSGAVTPFNPGDRIFWGGQPAEIVRSIPGTDLYDIRLASTGAELQVPLSSLTKT